MSRARNTNTTNRGLRAAFSVGIAAAVLAGCVHGDPETAQQAARPKTRPQVNFTSFSEALRCMDNLMLAHGKRDIVITTAGIPDATGKVAVGTKEMLITAMSEMSRRSNAFRFIDYDFATNDLQFIFGDIEAAGGSDRPLPAYYIRGAVTQLDDNALDSQAGIGLALPFAELGLSSTQVVSLVSMDMNIGETRTRTILPGINARNSMAVVRSGQAGDAGGKIGKAGISINVAFGESEGLGAATRALIELGLIETMGKLTNVPYWKCLQIEKTNPEMFKTARDWYDGMTPQQRVEFVANKLAGAGFYKGTVTSAMNPQLADAIGQYRRQAGLNAAGTVDFDIYYSLLDSDTSFAVRPTSPAEQQRVASLSPGLPAARPQQQAAATPVTVTVTSDRGVTPTYRVNENLTAQVSVDRDAFLYCYYQDATGTIARVFPNRFAPDPFVAANTPVDIPTKGAPFRIQFERPSRQSVFCTASAADLTPNLPEFLKTGDLRPLQTKNSADVVNAFRELGKQGVGEATLPITVR